jgi:hypothetical protein
MEGVKVEDRPAVRFVRDHIIGGYTSDDGRFHIRKYEERFNLRRVYVNRGWRLRDGSRVVGDYPTLREAKEAASNA